MKTNPNPQGKGLVPVLDAWQSLQPAAVAPKSAPRLLGDYMVSLLVLSAEFSFKPVPGKPYYLYWREGDWQLSLISPVEWGLRLPGECLGECQLAPRIVRRQGDGTLGIFVSTAAGKALQKHLDVLRLDLKRLFVVLDGFPIVQGSRNVSTAQIESNVVRFQLDGS